MQKEGGGWDREHRGSEPLPIDKDFFEMQTALYPDSYSSSIRYQLLMFVNHIRHAIRPRHIFALKNSYPCQRKFSLISVHTKFPASLYRFQVQRKSALIEYKHGGDAVVDALKIAADGLVYPRVSINDIPR